jgi:hypothetical protein
MFSSLIELEINSTDKNPGTDGSQPLSVPFFHRVAV